MPRRSLHNPDADDRPAFGLRDDAFDEQLRSRTAKRESRELLQDEERYRRRRVKKIEHADLLAELALAADHHVRMQQVNEHPRRKTHNWRRSNRLTSSEVAAVFGAEVLRSGQATSSVTAYLYGLELTRDDKPFDVEAFLVEKLGFLPKARRKGEWQGNYSLRGIRHKLVLKEDKRGARIVVNLHGRRRLTVYFAGGCLKSNGDAEARIVRDLSARALKSRQRWDARGTTVTEWWAVCVPRSEHFRKAIAAEKKKPRSVLEFPPIYFMVERMSATVIGLRKAICFDG